MKELINQLIIESGINCGLVFNVGNFQDIHVNYTICYVSMGSHCGFKALLYNGLSTELNVNNNVMLKIQVLKSEIIKLSYFHRAYVTPA